ncbi:MAG: cellulose binding domain-containing protein [Planctomycetota bacterium]
MGWLLAGIEQKAKGISRDTGAKSRDRLALEDRTLLAVGAPGLSYAITEKWNAGFTADVTIRNDENKAFPDWQLAFDYSSNITSIWNAEIVSHVGNHYVIKGPNWDDDLSIGETASFGFVASGSGCGARRT